MNMKKNKKTSILRKKDQNNPILQYHSLSRRINGFQIC